MNKALKYKIVVWCVVLFLVILMPQGIYKQSQIKQISIVSGLGIDKHVDEIEVSVSILVPEPSANYAPKQMVTSSTGKNLAEAINSIEIKIGKELGLAHCYIIILGDDFLSDDITKHLDYLMRSNIMGNNSAVLHTDKKAKEILETNSKMSAKNINNLQDIAKFNQMHYNSSNTSLIGLFNDYLSSTHCSVIGSITLEDDNSGQGEKTASGGDENSKENKSSQENSQSEKTITNKGDAIVIKNGKKLLTLNKEEIGYFSWLDKKSQMGYLTIENFFDETLKDAKITLKLKHEKASFNPRIQQNCPVLEINIFFECFVENIQDKNSIASVHKYMLTEEFQNKVKEKICSEINKSIKILKEHNFDIIDAYNIFNNKLGKKWKNYLKTLENEDDYIQNLEAVVSVSMESKF